MGKRRKKKVQTNGTLQKIGSIWEQKVFKGKELITVRDNKKLNYQLEKRKCDACGRLISFNGLCGCN